jgi:hypothetical protein
MAEFALEGLGPVVIILPLLWATVAVLIVLWIALPFAVFGIKRRLDRLIDLMEERGTTAPPPVLSAGNTFLQQKRSSLDGVSSALRRELHRIRGDLTEESLTPGLVYFYLGSDAFRLKWAEIRHKGEHVDLEIDLGSLSRRFPALNQEAALAKLEEELAGSADFRFLTVLAGQRAVIQISPGTEARIPRLGAILKTEILDKLPK